MAKFPEISIYLTRSDHTLDIVDEHIDLAIRTGTLSDSVLVATRVGEIRRVVCGSPAYFSAHGTPKTLDDLAKHMCVTYTTLPSGMTWVFIQPSRRQTESRGPSYLPIEDQYRRSGDRRRDCG
nr:LysR substrate-binding domain-containing protein [Mesorhizobium camelthorni]